MSFLRFFDGLTTTKSASKTINNTVLNNKGWFYDLFGFEETSYSDVKEMIEVHNVSGTNPKSGLRLISKANGRFFSVGTFTTPSLAQLRQQTETMIKEVRSETSLKKDIWGFQYDHIAVGDVLELHHRFPKATFQAASQFNCLEFPDPRITPEHGVTGYKNDRTQGPACALACAAGTVYRNYFVSRDNDGEGASTGGSNHLLATGQNRDWQINNLCELEQAVENDHHRYWTVHNGYVTSPSEDKLESLNTMLARKSEKERDALLSLIRIGLHRDVGVTFTSRFEYVPKAYSDSDSKSANEDGIVVTQVYASALSCAYSGMDNDLWEPLARMVLDAVYEATLLAAVQNYLVHRHDSSANNCSRDVFLTFLGGGVFGNDPCWINDAIAKALIKVKAYDIGLRVHICHYRNLNNDFVAHIDTILEEYERSIRAQCTK